MSGAPKVPDLPPDLCEAIIRLRREGVPYAKISARLRLPQSTVFRWAKAKEAEGVSMAPPSAQAPQGGANGTPAPAPAPPEGAGASTGQPGPPALPAPPEAPPGPVDEIAELEGELRRLRAYAADLHRAGNLASYQVTVRTIATVAKTLSTMRRADDEDEEATPELRAAGARAAARLRRLFAAAVAARGAGDAR